MGILCNGFKLPDLRGILSIVRLFGKLSRMKNLLVCWLTELEEAEKKNMVVKEMLFFKNAIIS